MLVVGLAVVVLSFAQAATPQTTGRITVDGMSAEVTVARDASGVPHLTGSTLEDLARAQGFVHAQDRFFDMDLRRHIASGRLSELVGKSGLPADRVVRTLGWHQVAEQSVPLLAPETRRVLQAYSEGVNAYLESRSRNRLSLEYAVLGISLPDRPIEDWTPVDSVAWLTAMAWDLKGNYTDELSRARLTGRVTREQIIDLYPPFERTGHDPILGTGDWAPGARPPASSVPNALADVPAPSVGETSSVPTAPDWYAAVQDALAAVPALYGRGEGVGSNSWVVSGDLTKSGKPLLANDPHLGTRLPGIWYQNSLTCQTLTEACPLRVSGFSFPGLPGIMIGHNDRIAWGFTNLGPDVSDFYLERTDVEGRVLKDGVWTQPETRVERIQVAGGPTETITVRTTSHGPIVSDVLPSAKDGGVHAPTFGPGASGDVYALSLAWTGLRPSKTADALLGLNKARDFTQFRTALRDLAAPSQNVIYADVDGHIGYQAPGVIPVRAPSGDTGVPGYWPSPGWDSHHDWSAEVPFDDLPWALDPAGGVIVAANQQVSASPTPFLTTDWDPGYRSQRIHDLLSRTATGGSTVADMEAIQRDDRDPTAQALIAALNDVDLRSDPFTASARELLNSWDGSSPARGEGSAAAAYLNAVWSHLMLLTFDDELPEDMAANGGARFRFVMSHLLTEPNHVWWDDAKTPGVVEGRGAILSQAMVDAREDLTRRLGKDPKDWQWGELHTWTPTHPVLGGDNVPGIVRWAFNDDPVPLGGGSAIVNANGWDASKGYAVTWAPSMRMVVDLADLDASVWINQTGASGHPLSDHYTDQVADWAAGRNRPWPFTARAVAAATEDTLVLAPRS